ncbi:hypothetical protein SK128_005408, partial [Halocaridina rubra]
RNNIQLSGVEERRDGETWEQTATVVSALLAYKLQLEGMTLERAHRVGQLRDDKPHPIVAPFSCYCDRKT